MSELALISAAFLDRVQCFGNETNLLECSGNEIGDTHCTTSEGAGVRCEGRLRQISVAISCIFFLQLFVTEGV